MTQKSMTELIKALTILKKENYIFFKTTKQQVDCIANINKNKQ